MIFEELTVHNVGVFRGRHQIDLAPPDKDKPVVLFGGLNGGGKTTLLEAIQLALYGKLAAPVRQFRGGYDAYLREAIHRGVKPTDGASVRVAFQASEDGSEKRFCVARSWAVRGTGVQEDLEVHVDGQYDRVLTETWSEQVERFIPANLAHLFFFDGERIESLADPDQSSLLLREAISALLGVDLVDQLRNDLVALERRKRKDAISGPGLVEIEQAERRVNEVGDELAAMRQEQAALRNDIERLEGTVGLLDERFQREGGGLVEERRSIEREHAQVDAQLKAARLELVELSAGCLPIVMLSNQLEQIRQATDAEENALQAAAIQVSVSRRDEVFLAGLRERCKDSVIVDWAAQHLTDDRKVLGEQAAIERYLEMDPDTRGRVRTLQEHLLSDAIDRARRLVTQVQQLEIERADLDRKLAAIPDDDAISELVKERAEAHRRLDATNVQHEKLTERFERLKTERATLSHQWDSLLRDQQAATNENEDTVRILQHSERARDTLERFRIEVIRQHVARLEQLIFEGYAQLLRKKGLVSRIEIDPETCRLQLFNRQKQPISAQRLSAGERQLLAVSILWGLGKASGRPLPIVVDTPLGRLDSKHRLHLVERYFPLASHQVILLSTDEEIDEHLFESLQPSVGHIYHLTHDDTDGASTVESGYFWEEAAICH